MQIKDVIIIILGLILVFLIVQIFVLRNGNSQMSDVDPESTRLQREILYESFIYSTTNEGSIIGNIEVYEDSDKPFFLFDSISLPILMIVMPPTEDICNSCINYAVHSVKYFFPDFLDNKRVIVFSHKLNSRIKSQMDRKKMYYCVSDSCKLGLIHGQASKPFYVVLNPDRKASMFFTPNNLMPELTDRYLKIVKEKYFRN